jgi:hypothetical protein
VRSPPPPAAIRPSVKKWIPGEERGPAGRELDPPHQSPGDRGAERPGMLPPNRAIRPRHEPGLRRKRAGKPAGDDREQDQAE